MSAVPPSYASIIALDEKIRSFSIPVAMDPTANEPDTSATATTSMQSFVRSHYRELGRFHYVSVLKMALLITVKPCFFFIEASLRKH